MPAPSTPQTIPDVTEDIELGSGLGSSRDNGIFDQIRANEALYFCFGAKAVVQQTTTCETEESQHTTLLEQQL